MKTIRRVAKNTAVLLISQIVSLVSGYLFIMYTAQYLGPKGFGILSFALALASIFGLISDMGLSQLCIREISRDYSVAERYIGNVFFMKMLLSCLTLSVIILVVTSLTGTQKAVVFLIGLAIIIEYFNKMFYSIFQAFEKMEFQSIGQILNSTGLLVGALIAIDYNLGVIGFALIYVLVNFITLIYSSFVSKFRFITPSIKFELSFWRNLLKESVPFAITGISISIFLWIDTVMLEIMKGDEVVGWYTAAYKLVLVLRFIPFVLTYSIFPLLSKYSVSSHKYLLISFEKMFKALVFIGLPMGVGTVFIAGKVISEVYGAEYNNSILILQILIWSSVLVFIRIPYERLMESINHQALVTKLFIIGAVFNIAVNLFLIPRYSYVGAGVATIITDLLLLILLIAYSNKLGYNILSKHFIYIGKIIISSLIMALFLEYGSNLDLLIQITSAAMLYALTSFLFKMYDEDEYKMIKSIFQSSEK